MIPTSRLKERCKNAQRKSKLKVRKKRRQKIKEEREEERKRKKRIELQMNKQRGKTQTGKKERNNFDSQPDMSISFLVSVCLLLC